MQYQVSRNGQLYGPYTLEDLQRYLASGNVLPTDLAKSEGMSEWLPVSQILGSQIPVTPPGPATIYGGPPAGFNAPAYPTTTGALYPDPPDLNWGLVLLFTILTCGIFGYVWSLIQAAWWQKIRPTSKVMTYYIITTVLGVINFGQSAVLVNITRHHGMAPTHNFTGSFIGLAVFIMSLVARYTFRAELEEHYNGPEPIGLRLGPIMTFFFGILYFQYHFNRINQIKQSMRYRGAAV